MTTTQMVIEKSLGCFHRATVVTTALYASLDSPLCELEQATRKSIRLSQPPESKSYASWVYMNRYLPYYLNTYEVTLLTILRADLRQCCYNYGLPGWPQTARALPASRIAQKRNRVTVCGSLGPRLMIYLRVSIGWVCHIKRYTYGRTRFGLRKTWLAIRINYYQQ